MSSFILIIFYQNKKSIISRIYTIMINRIGDATLLIRITIIIRFNSWIIITSMLSQKRIILILIIIRLFSKRAQIPFSSWLTEAMAAPTPVSALVHSSTLVTAGVYLIIRFEPQIKYSNLNESVFTIRIITLTMARINSLLEWDIKKIVALSTLSQLRIIFIAISINLYTTAFFHIIIHAIFKALIFLCRRTFISTANRQDMRKIGNTNGPIIFTSIRFNVSNMTLCRFPFSSRFYSKEVILEVITINKINIIIIIMFYSSMLITMVYSIKLILIINTNYSFNVTPIKESIEQITSKRILLLPAIAAGNKINWYINVNNQIPYLTNQEKFIPVLLIIMRLIITITNYTKNNLTIKNRKRLIIINYMWFIKTILLEIKIKFFTNLFIMFKTTENGIFVKRIKSTTQILSLTTKVNFKTTHHRFNRTMTAISLIGILLIYLNSLIKSTILKILR